MIDIFEMQLRVGVWFSDSDVGYQRITELCTLSIADSHFSQAEARAEFAERSVQKLQKEVDRLEGETS